MNNKVESPHPGLGFGAFVFMMACFMALNGLAVDTMLPALPAIGQELGLENPNSRQWVITSYLLGFGIFQLFYGPLSDRFGRRPVLLTGVSIYAFFSLITVFVGSFEAVVLSRFLQGAGAAVSRVLVIAIVRDCYSGRTMAKVMSLSFIIFLLVPILAPAIGQAVMVFVSWHWIFLGLAIFAMILTLWAWLYLPETLCRENRLPLSFSRVLTAFTLVVTTRQSIGYSVAMMLMMGTIFGYINSAQQLFADSFDAERLFTLYFALTALSMALASFLNARIVEHLGTRRVSHTAVCAMLLVSVIHWLIAYAGYETLVVFVIFQSLGMFCFGLAGPNFGAMAMEPVGHIAGTASSVQGCMTTVGAAVLGYLVGQAFDGTALPFISSYVLLTFATIVILFFTEGRLFQPLHESVKDQPFNQ
ncbi:MAG: multidrug effflux MFS transporter [Granulosicoccus sp.]